MEMLQTLQLKVDDDRVHIGPCNRKHVCEVQTERERSWTATVWVLEEWNNTLEHRAGLTIRGAHTNVRRRPFFHTRSHDFLWWCTFSPKKVDDLFLVVVVVTFKPKLNVQMSKQHGKNLEVNRGPLAAGLIRPWNHKTDRSISGNYRQW